MTISENTLHELKKGGVNIFGDVNFSLPCAYERAELVSFFCILKDNYPDLAKIAFHVRNENKISSRQGSLRKKEGLLTGASDIIIPGKSTLIIELKRRDRKLCSISKQQVAFLKKTAEQGAFTCLAFGAISAIEAVKSWHTTNKK